MSRGERRQKIIKEGCDNIVKIISRGSRALDGSDNVLIVGDYGDISPEYTETLKQSIIERTGAEVRTLYFPKKRPMRKIPPNITRTSTEWATVVIGTYSNQGDDIRNKERANMSKGFRNTITTSNIDKGGNIKLYVVAVRQTLSTLKSLAGDIDKVDLLSLKVKEFLDQYRGEEVRVETDNCRLTLEIARDLKVGAAVHSAENFIMNLPEGETAFQPELGTVEGQLCFREGSYYALSQPIRGKFIMNFHEGKVTTLEDIDGKDANIIRLIEAQFEDDPASRHLAEVGIGTNLLTDEVPIRDQLYNSIIMEKVHGFHIAYGCSDMFGAEYGNIKAKYHTDNLFTYGNIIIDGKYLIRDGKINTDVL